ncbi:glycosyltransferase [Longilinea arvoryzae]|uniref:Glycosyltransferase n=1 Tax=Longilinea arvoryzae TaxID=360412 RepID=A0A0S7B8U0_9CHLR|nr:glycosyltransferase family 4 protein [Longilinea arvoryzae]GAP13935.1 glycosyltransferase [Longilinea arvoryzae]
MRIAAIATSRVPSTTANSIQVVKACHGLVQLGYEVCLYVPGERTTPWPKLASHYGLETPFSITWLRTQKIWRRYDFALKAVENARAWNAWMVYTWTPQAALMAQMRGFPVILEMHDRPTGKMGPWLFRRWLKTPGRKRLMVITQALRDLLERDYASSMNGLNIQVAPNAVDLEHYSHLPEPAAARQQLGLPEGPTAVYSGHFYAGRGIDLLLGLAKAFPQVHFLWVGGRPEDVQEWKARLSELGVGNVTLTGFIEQRRLPLYQAAGDILLMPYERQIAGSSGGNSAEICSPMKMFDYLATGRPILSSDLPVLHEVLNERNAIFCQAEDLDSWEKALQGLLNDPLRRQALGDQARNYARMHTWRNRAEQAIADLLD